MRAVQFSFSLRLYKESFDRNAKNGTFHPENRSADADCRHGSNLARSLVQSLMRGLHRLALALLVVGQRAACEWGCFRSGQRVNG